MHTALSRIPVRLHVSVTKGLLITAGTLVLFGIVAMGIFSESTETSGSLWWKKTTDIPLSERLPALFIGIFLFVLAVLCVVLAIKLFLIQGAYKKYLAILSSVESINVRQIARITATTPEKVYRDIQAMIDSGSIEDFYIDHGTEEVISKKFVPKSSHKTVVECTGCGGHNEVIVGITKSCSFCRQPLVMRRPKQQHPG